MSDPIDEGWITRYIVDTFGGVDVVSAMDAFFFFYDPGRDLPLDRRLPFATIVTTDEHDQASDLNRAGVFRLNVGVSRETFRSLFGELPPSQGGPYEPLTGYDFTALDTVLPHPVYGRLHWLCVLNPGTKSFERVKPLLAEAYALAAERSARRQPAEPTQEES
jgi:hypothetical protein